MYVVQKSTAEQLRVLCGSIHLMDCPGGSLAQLYLVAAADIYAAAELID